MVSYHNLVRTELLHIKDLPVFYDTAHKFYQHRLNRIWYFVGIEENLNHIVLFNMLLDKMRWNQTRNVLKT